MEHLISLITSFGYFGYIILFIIIFLESFPPTFFLPGDSLLFTTGLLASQGYFNLALLISTFFIAGTLGYIFSHIMGEKLRNIILHSNDRYWFKKKHLDYTHQFYNKYGAKTIIIGRFVPVVRSFGPILAGVVDMEYKKFFYYTLIGGILWSCGMTLAGFYLGRIIPNVYLYFTPIILVIIFASLLPSITEYVHLGRKNK